jgi:hypothetical protein
LVYIGTILYGMYLLKIPSQMVAAAVVLRFCGLSLDHKVFYYSVFGYSRPWRFLHSTFTPSKDLS